MVKRVEKDIQIRLKKGQSVIQIVKHLVKNRDDYPRDLESHVEMAQFFYNSGHYKELIDECKAQVKHKKPVAWNLLYLVLKRTVPDKADAMLKQFMSGAQEKDQLESFVKLPTEGSPELSRLKRRYSEDIVKKAQEKKNKLFEKIEFYRVEKLIEEENNAIKELELFYPDDPRTPRITEEFKERWAQYLVSKKPKSVFQDEIERLDLPTEGEKKIAVHLLAACSKIVDKKPGTAYNFAVMFYFMGCFEEALIMGRRSEQTQNQSWFIVDILIKTRRFVEALAMIDQLEKRYANDPETQFSATYQKAIAHWGLHQGAKALELMKGIVNIRPTYRSAQSLYSKWNGGLSER